MAATSLTLARPRVELPSIPPEQLPDVTPMAGTLQAHLDALQQQWAQLSQAQKQAIIAGVATVVAGGTLASLLDIPVDITPAAAVLTAAMVEIGAAAARQVVAEAAQQGVHLAPAAVSEAVFGPTADVAAKLLAEEMRAVAVRAVLATGPDASPQQAADVAEAALGRYGDGSTERTLGAALHGSMTTARAATLRDGPVGAIYASEVMDRNTCKPCAAINGRWLCNTDDLAPLELTYPMGAYGGYIGCLGGDRCRGTVVGVWRKGRTTNQIRPLIVDFNPEQPRIPAGQPGGGRFLSIVDHLKDAIRHHLDTGEGDPFDGYSREQLRRVARRRGHALERGESRESIIQKLLDGIGKPTPEPTGSESKAIPGDKVPTWEELGKPMGPSPIGEVIGHMGGTYERLPGEPRRYRVIAEDGRDISDDLPNVPDRNQTADDARTALRMDAYYRDQRAADANSTWRKALGAITGSWSYETGDVEGFDAATPEQRNDIAGALTRWTSDKAHPDAIRQAEPRVNTALRGAIPRTDDIDRDIHTLDLALSMSRTKRNITVYRGYSSGAHILPPDWQSRDLTGLEWATPGFTPTSADKEAAEAYVGHEEHRGFAIRLKLPKGSSAIAISDAIGGVDNEGEVLLPRGLKLRVIKDNGKRKGLRWLDVELVPTVVTNLLDELDENSRALLIALEHLDAERGGAS